MNLFLYDNLIICVHVDLEIKMLSLTLLQDTKIFTHSLEQIPRS